MSYRNQEDYRYDELRDAAIARALSHAARIRLLRQIRVQPASVTDLAANHATNRTTLANHIRSLILAELITYTLVDGIPIYEVRGDRWPSWLHAYVDRQLLRAA